MSPLVCNQKCVHHIWLSFIANKVENWCKLQLVSNFLKKSQIVWKWSNFVTVLWKTLHEATSIKAFSLPWLMITSLGKIWDEFQNGWERTKRILKGWGNFKNANIKMIFSWELGIEESGKNAARRHRLPFLLLLGKLLSSYTSSNKFQETLEKNIYRYKHFPTLEQVSVWC